MILSDRAQFELARKLRGKTGATIAEVFTFLSGLYFRGKFAYATAFARSARGTPGVLVITPTRGLVDATTRIHLEDLREFAAVNIREDDSRYRLPIERDAQRLAKKLPLESEVHSSWEHCHRQIRGCFAGDFLARNFGSPRSSSVAGDMSRGGLMLRCAVDRQELRYVPVAGATVNGKRPAKLAPAQIHCRGFIRSDGFGSLESFRGWESFVPYLFVLRRRVKLTYLSGFEILRTNSYGM